MKQTKSRVKTRRKPSMNESAENQGVRKIQGETGTTPCCDSKKQKATQETSTPSSGEFRKDSLKKAKKNPFRSLWGIKDRVLTKRATPGGLIRTGEKEEKEKMGSKGVWVNVQNFRGSHSSQKNYTFKHLCKRGGGASCTIVPEALWTMFRAAGKKKEEKKNVPSRLAPSAARHEGQACWSRRSRGKTSHIIRGTQSRRKAPISLPC